jgi:hypothetical protein
MSRARFWTCRRCQVKLPRTKQKCPECGAARPVRKTAAQKALSDEYAVWETRFGAVCGICGRAASQRRRLDRDHDHKMGAARGLLCARCNRALPNWMTADWLRAAALYLDRHHETYREAA